MQKEIFHQPISIDDIILNFLDKETNSVFFPKIKVDFNNVSQLMLVACGTAYHSCMIAKYWFEQFAEIPTSIDIGSEYRYRKDRLNKNTIGIVVSQSGETMDTLECLKNLPSEFREFFEKLKKTRRNSEKIIDLISRAKREENFEVFLRLKTAILSKISTF